MEDSVLHCGTDQLIWKSTNKSLKMKTYFYKKIIITSTYKNNKSLLNKQSSLAKKFRKFVWEINSLHAG